MRMKLMAKSAVMVVALLGGCVFPSDQPTGLELSWFFLESNQVDGEEGVRVRSCIGANVERMLVQITDTKAELRRGHFNYGCSEGFQTAAEFRTDSSDAFVALKTGNYRVSVDTLLGDATTRVRELEVNIQGREPTLEQLELALDARPWVLELRGTQGCTEVTLDLRYADAEQDLALPERDEAGEIVDLRYRQNLVSDSGLSLAGAAVLCDGLAEDHTFEGVDLGLYRLVVGVDGQVCELNVAIDPGSESTVIDLANLGCAG